MGILKDNTAQNLRAVSIRMMSYIPSDIPAGEWNLGTVVDQFAAANPIPEQTKLGYLSKLKSAVGKFIADSDGTLRSKHKTAVKSHNEVKSDEVKTFSLPIPLRNDLILTMDKLPRDLTVDEADRIATIIKSFALKID